MKRLFTFVLFSVFLSLMTGCSYNQVKIYEMEDFSTSKEDSLITYTDPKTVETIQQSFKTAKRQSGMVNMDSPDYQVKWSQESYFLWLGEDRAIIMKTDDTHTIYRLSKDSAIYMNDLLH